MRKLTPETEELRLLWNIAEEARQVMIMLREHGKEIVPHLLDSDDNCGERLRKLLYKYHFGE